MLGKYPPGTGGTGPAGTEYGPAAAAAGPYSCQYVGSAGYQPRLNGCPQSVTKVITFSVSTSTLTNDRACA